MFQHSPYVALSLLGGAIVPVQLALIHALRSASGASQIQATLVLYLGGVLASLLLAYALSGSALPPQPAQAAWWMWTPGLLGALYILFMFVAAPKIGAANTLVWVFLGQMLFATLIEYQGWLGMAVRVLNGWKLAGLALIALGGLLMIWGESAR